MGCHHVVVSTLRMTDDVDGREPQYQKKSSEFGSRFWYIFQICQSTTQLIAYQCIWYPYIIQYHDLSLLSVVIEKSYIRFKNCHFAYCNRILLFIGILNLFLISLLSRRSYYILPYPSHQLNCIWIYLHKLLHTIVEEKSRLRLATIAVSTSPIFLFHISLAVVGTNLCQIICYNLR